MIDTSAVPPSDSQFAVTSYLRSSLLLDQNIYPPQNNVLYGSSLTDEATAYKVFRADVVRGMEFRARRFEWCPEVTALTLRAGHTIAEVPIRYHARSVSQGKKIRSWDFVEAVWTLVRYRFRR